MGDCVVLNSHIPRMADSVLRCMVVYIPAAILSLHIAIEKCLRGSVESCELATYLCGKYGWHETTLWIKTFM